MGKTRRSHRRRRGRLTPILKPLAVLAAVAAMLWAVALFFRMDHIVVSGNERYTETEVLAASGLQTGGNLYFLNKFDVKESIFDQLPYVETVRINRKLPDTLLIEVGECKAAAGVESENGVWLISEQGRLLEETAVPPVGCPVIAGASPVEPAATKPVDLGEDYAYRLGVALTLLRESETRGMRANIGVIDLSDDTALSFTYLGRFTVRQPWTTDVSYKLESLETVVDYLENNEAGRIDLMTEGKASFIPE
ncbi:MAG: FtsQ-type POTRA domain-containing protein [Oscillospiraceae bacterium]|nr:FtsQ-type POTRA domain-containing protein [Oscillospiraceae bacterium]